MRWDRLPLTQRECAARFERAVRDAAGTPRTEPIGATGPDGGRLGIGWTRFGPMGAPRVLVVMSGTHGVEGFACSAVQCEAIDRLAATGTPADTAVVFVHGVNPWGMAWWRRQNESNVDLNRNWARGREGPLRNDAYDELHPLVCPGGPDLPDADALTTALLAEVERRGLPWVRDAISTGQSSHADGLHFAGTRTEESTAALERLMPDQLRGAELVLALDLHTGHGGYATVTLLSDSEPDSAQDRFLRHHFGDDAVEATLGNPDATTGTKGGQLAAGFAEYVPHAEYHSSSVEFGTLPDEVQILTAVAENWVHHHGDRTDPAHAAAVWAQRCSYTPDDPDWERAALAHGRSVLDRAVAAVAQA